MQADEEVACTFGESGSRAEDLLCVLIEREFLDGEAAECGLKQENSTEQDTVNHEDVSSWEGVQTFLLISRAHEPADC